MNFDPTISLELSSLYYSLNVGCCANRLKLGFWVTKKEYFQTE